MIRSGLAEGSCGPGYILAVSLLESTEYGVLAAGPGYILATTQPNMVYS